MNFPNVFKSAVLNIASIALMLAVGLYQLSRISDTHSASQSTTDRSVYKSSYDQANAATNIPRTQFSDAQVHNIQLCQFFGPPITNPQNSNAQASGSQSNGPQNSVTHAGAVQTATCNCDSKQGSVSAPFDNGSPFYTPANPSPVCGIDCLGSGHCGCPSGNCPQAQRWGNTTGLTWKDMRPIPFQLYGQGEYLGRERLAHVSQYRLRVDDQISFLFRNTREKTPDSYRISVGDQFEIKSLSAPQIDTTVEVLPDGTIAPIMIKRLDVTRMTVAQLNEKLESLYLEWFKNPTISVKPIKFNTRLTELINTVDNRAGNTGGQGIIERVNPEGAVALPEIGTVSVQGLTLEELKREINLKYKETIPGVEVTPILNARAPRYVYVLGEVKTPGRYTLEGPTTVMQAIATAGSWNVGAYLQQIVIFRRGDDWRLMATTVNLRDAMLYANQPCPQGELWVSDADVILVPKGPLLLTDDYINLIFTRGIYGVMPFSTNYSFRVSTVR